jgi:hypothetical protein
MNKHCKDCGKKLKNFYAIRCKKCNNKILCKNLIGHQVSQKTRKIISIKNKGRLVGDKNPMYRKTALTGRTKTRHHINLDRKNNKKTNILILQNKKHSALHSNAYRYLVKTGQVKKYIKWFLNCYYRR